MQAVAVQEKNQVGYNDLREYLALLEAARLLKRIGAEVNLRHDLGAVAARSIDQGGPALLFENIKDYGGMPLVTNIISTTAQLAIAFGTDADEAAIYQRVVDGLE